jgi:hypothetical protein
MKRCQDLGTTSTSKRTRRALSALDILARRRAAAAAWRGGVGGGGQRPSSACLDVRAEGGEMGSRKFHYCGKMCELEFFGVTSHQKIRFLPMALGKREWKGQGLNDATAYG